MEINQNMIRDILTMRYDPSIDIKNFNRMKIPIPPIDVQNSVVSIFDTLNDQKNNYINSIKYNEELKNIFINTYMKTYNLDKNKSTILKLGDISIIENGTLIVKNKEEQDNTNYPVYGGGDKSFYANKYNRDGKTCKISRSGMSEKNCVMLLDCQYFLNSSGFTIVSKNEKILKSEYLWYYLQVIHKQIYLCGIGIAQKNIDISKFNSLNILIPPINKQIEIIEHIKKYFDDFQTSMKNNINGLNEIITHNIIEYLNKNN